MDKEDIKKELKELRGEGRGFFKKNWMYLAGGLAIVIVLFALFGTSEGMM